jgi:hypothetical protein
LELWSPNSFPVPSQQITMFLGMEAPLSKDAQHHTFAPRRGKVLSSLL